MNSKLFETLQLLKDHDFKTATLLVTTISTMWKVCL